MKDLRLVEVVIIKSEWRSGYIIDFWIGNYNVENDFLGGYYKFYE